MGSIPIRLRQAVRPEAFGKRGNVSDIHLESYGAPHTHGEGGSRPAFRVASAALLLMAGLACVFYGARFHKKTVLMPQENEALPVQIPEAFLAEAPSPAAPPQFTPGVETEPQLIREVTVGGVTRTDIGEVKRTYSVKAPSLCPT